MLTSFNVRLYDLHPASHLFLASTPPGNSLHEIPHQLASVNQGSARLPHSDKHSQSDLQSLVASGLQVASATWTGVHSQTTFARKAHMNSTVSEG